VDPSIVKRVALVTFSGCPELTNDDRLLVQALRRVRVDAVPIVWDTIVDWRQFDSVIIRSCWDYHLRPTEFLQWIDDLERLEIPLHNSAPLVRWNADKRYLLELQEIGVRIPPTVWLEDGEEADVQGILKAKDWDTAVVKPTVSASAHHLKRVFINEPTFRVSGPAMVQQFIPEVQETGEWSVVFICGEYSHAVVKRPATGDFRVQSQFGGTAMAAEPGRQIIDAANRIINGLPEQSLYARIDGIQDESGFVLMEVELIEPVLFLGLSGAATHFAEKIARLLDTCEALTPKRRNTARLLKTDAETSVKESKAGATNRITDPVSARLVSCRQESAPEGS
jgi:glutathione synthase/RimK-type ligase-like ATP-grasp enzyme